jgi:LPXTG-motif cell wall-anchored protein
MVHTAGIVIVHDGDRYFELANVVAEFPVAGGKWEYTVVTHPLSPPIGENPGGEDPNGEDPNGEDPPVSDPASTTNSHGVESGATSGRTHLAATGASFEGASYLAVAAALLGGGLLLIRRRRRHDAE